MSFGFAFLITFGVIILFEILKSLFTKKEIITDRLHDGEESEDRKLYTFMGYWFGISLFFVLAPFKESFYFWIGLIGLIIPLALFLIFMLPALFEGISSKAQLAKEDKKYADKEKDAKKFFEDFDELSGKEIFSIAYKRCLESYIENRAHESTYDSNLDSYEPIYELFVMFVLESWVTPFTDGSYQFPYEGLELEKINEKLKEKSFDYHQSDLENLKKKLREVFEDLDFNYDIPNSWNFTILQRIIMSKGLPETFYLTLQAQSDIFNATDLNNLYKETIKLVSKEKLNSLEKQLEEHGTKIINKAIKKIEKNRSKEKVTAAGLEPYIEVTELMMHEKDPIKRLQAKSFLDEAMERLGDTKRTPTIKQKVEQINRLNKFFEE